MPANRPGQRGHDRGVLAERPGGILGLIQGHADAHHRAECLRPEREFPLTEAAAAHRAIMSGHVSGKIVLIP